MKKVLLFGTFDYLHPGHLYVFKQAKKRGKVTVVVARDVNVTHIKGHKPDHNEEERRKSVQNAFKEAKVILGDPDDYLLPLKEEKPDLVLLGYDQNMPPGCALNQLPCAVERLKSYRPEKYKSSLLAGKQVSE